MALTVNKFSLITQTQIPHKCASCGIGATGEPDFFIDWGLQIDWEGAVYLCIRCGAEMARLIGYMSPDAVQTLRNQIDDAEEANEQLTHLNIDLNSELSHYRALYGRLPVPEQADTNDSEDREPEPQKPSDRFA